MSIRKYRAFLKTVDLGSFTKAAGALNLTQPGISHILRDLETEWNVSLLERNSAGLRLTAEGSKLLAFVRSICDAEDRLLLEVEELHDLHAGLIRIGTFSSVATQWVPNVIKAFQSDYPRIEYELLLGDYTEIEHWLREGRVDCGFLRYQPEGDLEIMFLEQDRLLVVLPATHALAGESRFPLKGLEGAPFMLMEKGEKNEISEYFARHGLEPDIRFTTYDDHAIMAMVEKGLGISILPELVLRGAARDIVALELEQPLFRNIGFGVRHMQSAPRAVRRFVEYLPFRNGLSCSLSVG